MLKVLHIIAVPVRVKVNEGKIGVNGPERRMANVSKLWRSHNVDVFFMYPKRGNLYSHFSADITRYSDFEIKSKFDIGAIFKIALFAKTNNIQIIHTHGPGSLDLIASLAAKLVGVKIVVSRPSFIDDLTNISSKAKVIYKIVDWFTYRLVDMMTLVSKNGFDRAPLKRKVLIQNGVDLTKFTPVLHGDHLPVKIGMVAQLKEGKGWDDFIEIVEKVSLNYKIEAHIFGDGILRNEMELKLARNNSTHLFKFHGNIENVNDGLKNIDIFLFTSYREGLSVAIIEAMAKGLPIVAYNVGGAEEQVINGANGFIFTAGNINLMKEAIEILVEDKNLRFEMGRKSRLIAESKFDQESMLKNYVNLYEKI
jgi:glycosyltransferase involved in cell wall biosynthesis